MRRVRRETVRRAATLAAWLLLCVSGWGQGSAQAGCRKLTFAGEVSAGREWRQAIGGGWVLRLAPIAPGKAGYTGWDLVLDRVPGAGFPDALLLATPPYGSISEREIGTTFGLRAQDAIGWSPRSFRFLTDAAALGEGRRLFAAVTAGPATAAGAAAARRLMELTAHASAGELRVEDARLTPGVADAAPFAQSWAYRAARMPHTEVPAPDGKPGARGRLEWIRFSGTLWLPAGWKPQPGMKLAAAACPQ